MQATKTTTLVEQMSDYDRAVAWQMRSIELAERDNLQATRKGYGETCQMFEVPSRSNPHSPHVLTLYTAGEHNGQLFCPCYAQAHGLPCGHVGAVLRLLDYERENAARWMEATAGYQDEMPAATTHIDDVVNDLRGHGATAISREAW